ncbi:hypothetical protein TSUD_245520 [Trifolium subterraneum]|uniref:TF-B3 domain-containing protein n=1 Tax=Trifolium subterraneum TaxID=3900 RepID=A0A2Z6NGG0_TRISU|nr:hypothetical protein TSUD_245520 [Trifolium subterraneum]
MRISKGFSKFQRNNNLSHGDYCVFELIKKKPVVLKVTMFRAPITIGVDVSVSVSCPVSVSVLHSVEYLKSRNLPAAWRIAGLGVSTNLDDCTKTHVDEKL